MTSHAVLVACHECDTLQRVEGPPPGSVARCRCCEARLFGNPKGGLDTPLALTLSSAILFLVANAFPLLTLDIKGLSHQTTLSGAALALYRADMAPLAAVVWITSVLGPALIILSMLYVLSALRFSLRLPWVRQVLVWISRLQPWGMLDVFMLGVLVALVKLAGMADVVLGTGLYAYVALIFFFAAASSRLEPHLLWERLGVQG
jgi:paraquat-inducible protein A